MEISGRLHALVALPSEKKKAADRRLNVLTAGLNAVDKRDISNFNTLWTGDAVLRLYITTVQEG